MKLFEEEKKLDFKSFIKKDAILALMVFLTMTLEIISTFSDGTRFITLTGEVKSTHLGNFCSLLGDQLLTKKLNDKMFDEGVFSALTKSNYQILEFKGSEILLGTTHDDNSCSAYVRDDLGVRVFKFPVTESGKNLTYYRIVGIKEL